MKKIITLILLVLGTLNISAQIENLNGKWTFEKIISDKEIDEQGKAMIEKMFTGMYLAFDSTKYEQFVLDKIELGNWLEDDDGIFFISSKGYEYLVTIEKISENQLIFTHNEMKIQLLKTESKFKIADFVDNIAKVDGIEIDKKKLIGKWNWIETTRKDGKTLPAIKHSKDEATSYNFKKNDLFENKAPLGIELIAYWSISEDFKLVILQSDNKNEYFKILKLTKTELEIFNPKDESILRFVKGK